MTDKTLYRDPQNGKLSGVCAGLANHFGIEVWLVRILVISAALLGGTFLVLLAYLALTFMLEKQPIIYVEKVKTQQEHTLKSKPWQSGRAPSQLLNTVEAEMDAMETSVRNMEAYVTSDAFKVNREFRQL